MDPRANGYTRQPEYSNVKGVCVILKVIRSVVDWVSSRWLVLLLQVTCGYLLLVWFRLFQQISLSLLAAELRFEHKTTSLVLTILDQLE